MTVRPASRPPLPRGEEPLPSACAGHWDTFSADRAPLHTLRTAESALAVGVCAGVPHLRRIHAAQLLRRVRGIIHVQR